MRELTVPYSRSYCTLEHSLGPNGQSVPAQVKDAGGQTFKVEFCPRVVGEHKIAVNYRQVAVAGSPFSCKVYDVNAIKVKPVQRGTVGQPVTFLGKLFVLLGVVIGLKHFS